MKRRIISIITALALCLSLCPTWAFAAEADPALCPHHREHTGECGYAAPTEGQPCGHQHTAECYTLGILPGADGGDDYEVGADTENLLDCQHVHDSECGYVPADPGQPCGFVCRLCPIEDLIAALPDEVTPDNGEDVRGRLDEILALFGELSWEEQEQIDLSRCYALQEALDGANDPIPAAESVGYREASWNNGEVVYTDKTATCTPVENSTEAVTWSESWYAVNGNVTISEPITVTGDVSLILTDGCTLNASQGIVVTAGNSLTIYAQSGGTGTLNATGTTDSGNNASAGIGGSTETLDSGSITIHGGVVNATGGYVNMGSSGAGIGGGSSGSTDGNGGNSSTVTIYDGMITATSGYYTTNSGVYYSGAGIGGGYGNGSGGTGTSITIYGGSVTAKSQAYNECGAGIGGGAAGKEGGIGNSIVIYGGTITATSDSGSSVGGAGIGGGGGGSVAKSGDGTVTISGGTVTAAGGNYAAGIGGGGGYQGSYGMNVTGGTGSVTISGGIVDASSPTDVPWKGYEGAPIGNGGNATATATVSKTNAIVFENGMGTVCGSVIFDGSYEVPAGYTLNIPTGASLSGSGTLSGDGMFTTENLTENMISVPTDLYYNGQDRTGEIAEKVAISGGVTVCGKTFTVSGWSVEVSKTDEMTYTATYKNDSDDSKKFTKEITLQKSGTQFVGDGAVKAYKGDAETKDFTADDIITVKATPTPSGKAPQKAASLTAPTAGQMAVFVNGTQVSEPADVGEDGSYTMTVSAADVLAAARGPGTGITLTAKFVGNTSMADGAIILWRNSISGYAFGYPQQRGAASPIQWGDYW